LNQFHVLTDFANYCSSPVQSLYTSTSITFSLNLSPGGLNSKFAHIHRKTEHDKTVLFKDVLKSQNHSHSRWIQCCDRLVNDCIMNWTFVTGINCKANGNTAYSTQILQVTLGQCSAVS